MNSSKLRNLIEYVKANLWKEEFPLYEEVVDYLELQHYILVEKEKKTAALLREKNGSE